MTTPDPITTAREALDKLNKHVKPELNSPNCDRFNQIYAAFDYAEKLKAERDEALATRDQLYCDTEELMQKLTLERLKVTRLTSQLEQVERVITPFAKALKTIPHEGLPDDWRAWQTIELSHLRAASQWIKDRQAKGEG